MLTPSDRWRGRRKLMRAQEGFPEQIFSIRPRVVCQWIADLRDSHRITNHHITGLSLVSQSQCRPLIGWCDTGVWRGEQGVATVHKKLSGHLTHGGIIHDPWLPRLLIMAASQNAKYPGYPVSTIHSLWTVEKYSARSELKGFQFSSSPTQNPWLRAECEQVWYLMSLNPSGTRRRNSLFLTGCCQSLDMDYTFLLYTTDQSEAPDGSMGTNQRTATWHNSYLD